MDGLLSFLIFAGVFYLMMRFGCGAHMIHGHHGHGNKKVEKHIDPVCGKSLDAERGYGKMHEGHLYRFCSRDCLDKFEVEPEKYINKIIAKGESS